jgi:hypothetical protein
MDSEEEKPHRAIRRRTALSAQAREFEAQGMDN